jgi:heptosyltransferase-3
MKILILKYRNIGDVLLITPLIFNLKKHYSDALIDVSINKGTEQMLTFNPLINNIICYNRSVIKGLPVYKKIKEELKFIFQFRGKGYDIIINLTKGDRGAQIALFSGAKIRIGYENNIFLLKKAFTHLLPSQGSRHTVEVNLDPLNILKIPILSKNVEIYWSNEDDNIVNKKLEGIQKFIHIHPVSRWFFKCISDKQMSEIIDYCELSLNIPVVITASSDNKEINKVQRILDRVKSEPLNLSGELTLTQTAALNKRSEFFIGVDTAIMHISAANNVPVMAFFGPSGAHHWGPWDNNVFKSTYINKNGCQMMGMHRVLSESRGCQPCGQDGCNGSKISDCLMSWDINFIKKNIQEMLNE